MTCFRDFYYIIGFNIIRFYKRVKGAAYKWSYKQSKPLIFIKLLPLLFNKKIHITHLQFDQCSNSFMTCTHLNWVYVILLYLHLVIVFKKCRVNNYSCLIIFSGFFLLLSSNLSNNRAVDFIMPDFTSERAVVISTGVVCCQVILALFSSLMLSYNSDLEAFK